MATAGSTDIPQGDVVFDQKNVRIKNDGPNRSILSNGSLQVSSTAYGLIVHWHPQDDTVAFSNGSVSVARRPQSFWFELSEMKSYILELRASSYELTVMLSDGTRHPTFVFDIGKQSAFLDYIGSRITTRKSKEDKRMHIVIKDDIEALQKSFNSLQLFQEDHSTLVSRLVRDPLPTVAGQLAKVTNLFSSNAQPVRSPQISDGMLDLNPAGYEQFERVFALGFETEPGYDFVEEVSPLPALQSVTRSRPLGLDEWLTFFDVEGRVRDPNGLRQRIFRGGCSPEIRPEAWKFLLGVSDFERTANQRREDHSRLTEDYYRMKLQWKTFSAEQESRFTAFTARKNLVEKDVNRTDRTVDIFTGDGNGYLSMLSDVLTTYIMYDFDLGYVQGMSDLLSPILSVMQNEPDSFWCFAKFVSMIRGNFIDPDKNEEKDQKQLGVKLQLKKLYQLIGAVMPAFAEYLEEHESGNLYFCFRWILIWFKREFSFEETKRLWEVFWTGLPCDNFHLLFCVAILQEEKSKITENMFGLTEILKHINDMSYKIPLEENLIRAEQLYFQLLDLPKVAEIIGLPSEDDGDSPNGELA